MGPKCDRASYQTMLVYQVGELARADGGVNIYQQSWLSATVGRCRLVTTIEEETRDRLAAHSSMFYLRLTQTQAWD